jgi:isochorismate hydrolase
VGASVTDGFSHNYRMLVVEEGTFDRGEASHWINLFDMDMKYADVVGVDAAIEHLAALPEGLYDEAMPVLKAAGGREVVR